MAEHQTKRLTQKEIQDIIWKGFCSIPCSEQAQEERGQLILLVNEVIERRKKDGEWKE
jgi:hypothetical protein